MEDTLYLIDLQIHSVNLVFPNEPALADSGEIPTGWGTHAARPCIPGDPEILVKAMLLLERRKS